MASGIKQAVKSIPVIAVGRINDPAIAEKAIADGHCDMVGLVRGQIADAEFANKSREGRIEDIRLCIACNQGCNVEGRPKCTQNVVSGKETKDISIIKPALKTKKVMIIGGGPAGMEAARVAALRGHDVTLCEKTAQLGGLLNTVIKVPGREEFSQITRYLSHQLANLHVNIKFNTEVTPEMAIQQKPDAIIVATGARPYVEPVPGNGAVKAASPSQVLNGEVEPGKKVLIYECTGEQEAPNTAEYLGEKGVQVELVTSQISLFAGLLAPAGMIASRYMLLWPRLRAYGINLHIHTKIKAIAGRDITLADVWSGEESTIENVDTVVMSTGYLPNNTLYKSLQGKVKELYTIGDCVTPRRALNAIHDAYFTAFYI
jgi:thioredoxin reductase